MTKDLVSYLKFGNHFYGVELTQLNGEEKYYGVVLKKKRKQLDIESSFEVENSEAIKKHIPKGKPIVLVINTDSVLTKKVESKTNDPLKLVHLAFPNIKIEEFYYEVINQGENHFVCICRKSYVDDLLRTYASKQITIFDFTLGGIVSTFSSGYFENNTIQASNIAITTDGNKLITDITKSPYDKDSIYNINGLDINNNQLLSFSAALGLVMKTQNSQSNFEKTTKQLSDLYNQKQFGNQFLKLSLSLLFLALLINFLFFNHYYNEVNSLRETAQILDASKTKMISLSEKVQKTEKIVDDVLKSSASKSSFYVNIIINNLPESILLKELNFQPLLKKVKEDKAIENHKNQTLISGQSNNSIEFSQWISELENFKWVNSVEILNFEDISKSSSSFTIKLNMQDGTEN